MMLGDTVNPYLAARAVFRLVKDGSFAEGAHHGERIGEHIHTVALPGLGTGVGGVGSNTCAHQVRAAIDDILLGGFTPPQTLLHAGQRHSQLIGPRRSTDR
jgi:hypothetical protein